VVSAIPILDLVGVVGFGVASALAVRYYRERPLYRNYWLLWIVAVGHMALWAATVLLAGLGVAPALLETVLPFLVLAVGLTALLHIALYDNTGSEALLRRVEVSEARNGRIIDNYPRGAVLLFDRDLQVLLAGGSDLPGGTGPVADREGESLRAVLPATVFEALADRCRGALAGESGSAEVTVDGATYDARTLPVGAGSRAEGLLVLQNVTERQRREQALRQQRDDLTTLDRINRVIRDVDHALVGAETRQAVADVVADRLSADDPYRAALVAYRDEERRLVPAAWGGAIPTGADEAFPADAASGATDPGVRALDRGEMQVVRPGEGDGSNPWVAAARALDAPAVALVPVSDRESADGVLAVFADRADAFDDRELAVLDQLGETVGYALTAIERRERATVLAALHRATQDLLHAEAPGAVADIVVEAGTRLLAVEIAVYRYDPETHSLQQIGASADAAAVLEDRSVVGGDRRSPTWETFRAGERAVIDDVGGSAVPDGAVGSAMYVPLGEHGVLAAGTGALGAFDEHGQQLVELLAATTEAAFDRLDSESDLREREAELREQNRTLRRLQRVTDVIRDVDQAIVGASSRDAVEQGVCDRLTADDRFAFAWIATDDGAAVSPRAWAGDDPSYLDAVTFGQDADPPEPTVRTARTGAPTLVARLADHVPAAEWASHGRERGFESALSVPIVHRDVVYGVLTVYAAEAEAFDEEIESVFAELAETVAYAIDARETKRGLLETGGTELVLVIRDDDRFLSAVAEAADGPVRVVETRPAGDATTVYFEADGVTPDELADRAADLVAVHDVEPVSDREEGVYRATVEGSTLSDDAVEFGGIPREVEVTPGELRLTVSLLPHVDAREFVDRLRDRYPAVELLARRQRDAATQTVGTFRDEFESRVTDRQLEVLREAFESGYFESPRESSGQDVADRLGVSQPTVNHHLRVSQRRLIGLLFDGTE